MNENIDLTKILKDCPEGTKFWSETYKDVTFLKINLASTFPIELKNDKGFLSVYTKNGRLTSRDGSICDLFPSKHQQDWSKFTAPWYKKEKFDPKTLKPFDKVLVHSDGIWRVEFFSHIKQDKSGYWCYCIICGYRHCIPYNDDTKHLVGTRNEAPEFYRYWEV